MSIPLANVCVLVDLSIFLGVLGLDVASTCSA